MKQTYDTDSYTPRYSPENSIYQDDARLFHRAGYRYATVEKLSDGRVSAAGFSATAHLAGGGRAVLRLVPSANDSLRLLFGSEAFEPVASSPMLVGGKLAAAGKFTLKTTPAHYQLKWGARVIEIGRGEFSLRVLDGGKEIFALSNDQIAGSHPTPPLGMRLPADGKGAAEPYLSWAVRNDERFFGLGEKWNKVEKTSTRATIWASDTCGSNTTDMSYKSVPVLHSTRGWGLLVHTGCRSHWEIGTFSYTGGSVLSESATLDAIFWFAPTLADSVAAFTAITGRPAAPPPWSYGMWMSRCAYENRAQVEDVLARLRQEKIPCDVIHLDPLWMKTHYYFKIGVDACDFVWREDAWPDHVAMMAAWLKQGFSTCFWLNPYLPEGSPVYADAAKNGYLLRSSKGGLARLIYGEPVGMVDFTNPAAKEWWKDKLKALVAEGAAVFKPDYGDRVPEDAIAHDGTSGSELHNLYLHYFAEAAYQAVRETTGDGIVWRRSGYVGSQRYPGTWAGDTQVTWEAMRCCLRGGLSAGFNGEAFWSHDIGGFVGPKPDNELYIRWAQWGLLSPFSRFHGTTPREPWEYSPEAVAVVKKYTQLRYKLMPYLWKCGEQACATGMPILRHLHLANPDEPGTEHIDDQYLLGPDLLIAPIFAAGATSRKLYIPAGRWREWDQPAKVHTGPAWITVAAPLGRLPLLVRAGAEIPMFATAPQHLKGPLPKVTVKAIAP